MDLQITNTYTKAYVEILEIINYMGQEYKKKIPSKLLNFFEENKDLDYEYNLECLNESTFFLKETLIILALIEQKYWATEKEREILDKALKENEKKYQEDLREKYNPDNLFSNRNIKIEPNTTMISEKNSTKNKEKATTVFSMVEYKEFIFTRIKNWFKQIFNK